MKKKKTFISLILTLLLLVSLSACQEPSAGVKVPENEDAVESEIQESVVVDEGAVMAASLEELKSALGSAGGSESDPVIICITEDIEQDAKKVEDILTIKEGSHVVLEAVSSDISIRQTAGQSDAGTAVIIVGGTLELKSITIDANGNGRGVYVERGGNLTLNSGSCITGGTTSSKNVSSGLGVYVSAPLATGDSYGTLTINEGAKITGNTHAVSTYGRALGIGVYAGGHVVMNGGEITDNVDTTDPKSSEQRAAGGAVYCKSSVSSASAPWAVAGLTNFTMNGGIISGNCAYVGAGIYCSDYSQVELNSGFVMNNTAAYAGGALAMDGSTGNTEYLTKLHVTVSDMEITGNTARIGGAIYAGNGILDINGTTINDNTAYSDVDEPQAESTLCATATSGASGGAIYMAQATVSLSDVMISGNKAQSGVTGASFPMGNGGAIYVTNSTNYTFDCSLNIFSGHIIGNIAEGDGIYSGFGGGICAGFYPFEDKDAVVPTVNIMGGNITENAAPSGPDLAVMEELSYKTRGYGGSTFGIGTAQGSPVVNVSESAEIGDTLPEDLSSFAGDRNVPESTEGETPATDQEPQAGETEDSSGTGAVSADIPGTSAYSQDVLPSGAVTVSSEDELAKAVKDRASFIMLGSDIKVKDTVEFTSDTVLFGAGHTLSYDTEDFKDTLILVSEGKLTMDGIALNSGLNSRCLYVEKSAQADVNAASFTGRRLADQGLSVYNAGTLTMGSCHISGAASATINYLGIVYNRGQLTIKDGFSVDSESYVYTGTIYNEGTFDMEGGSFGGTGSNSNRKKYGSAVTNTGTFNMRGGEITGCRNSEAVFSSGDFNMSGGSIKDNDTTCISGITYNSVMSGGGVLIYGGTFNMYPGAEITGNAAYMGGGVGVYYKGSVFNMYGGMISGNLASIHESEGNFNDNNGCGGGVGIYGGAELNMYGGEISGNTAYIGDSASDERMGAGRGRLGETGLGGGIYVLSGTVNIDGGIITGNSAKFAPDSEDGGHGGGIYINDNSNETAIVNITAGEVTGNSSDSGLGNDIFSGSVSDPVRDVICLYVGGSAELGEIYLGTNRTMLGIGSEISGMSVASLTSSGRDSIGSAIVRYTDGVPAEDSDIQSIIFSGVSGLKFSDDKSEMVIDMMDLADVTSVIIEDVTFTGKEINAAALNAQLIVKDTWSVEAAGLSGLRATDMSSNIDVGTGYVTLRGDNIRYTGTLENVPFNIVPKDLDSEGFTVEFAEPDAVYIADGVSEFEPEVRISLDAQSDDSRAAYLTEGPEGDYTVSYENNKEVGTAYVILTSTGRKGSNYTGSLMIPFEIYEKAVAERIVLEESSIDIPTAMKDSISSYQLGITLEPEGAAGTDLIFESSDENVATVSDTGLVTAIGCGTTTITITADDSGKATALCKVNVIYYDVAGSSVQSSEDYQYYYEPVYWAVENGITEGMSITEGDGTIRENACFGVGEKCTKGEFLVMLWKMNGCPESEKYKDPCSVFTDLSGTDPDSELYKAAAWGCTEKIVIGMETDGGQALLSDNWLSRGDMAVIMWRTAGRPRVFGSMKFTDVKAGGYKKNGDMYRAVLWFAKQNLAKGYRQDDGSYIFGLTYGVLKEHAVTYLYRYVNLDE